MTTMQSHSATDCSSYLPGHRLHWTQWKHASQAQPLQVLQVIQNDSTFEVIIPGYAPFRWRHHAPAQLRAALDHARLPIVASPQFRMLRIDGVWFNCVPAELDFTLCG